MKKISLALVALGFLSISIQSCTSDPCKDKSATTLCSGKGTLVSNTNSCDCSCDAGYTGTACNLSITGQYIAKDILGTSTNVTPYSSILSLSGNTVTITSFKNAFFKNIAVGTLSGNTITLNPSQQPDNDGFKLSGTGAISSTGSTVTIKWTYTITGKNSSGVEVTDNFTGEWNK